MYRKLLIAIDPEDENEGQRALEAGVPLLDDEAEVHIVSVFKPGGAGFFPHVAEEAPEEMEAQIRERLELLTHKYLPPRYPCNLHVVAGTTPGEKLVALAGALDADLMLLISRGSGSHWLQRKATVEYVGNNAPCPVLILPAQAGEQSESPKA